MPARPCSSRSTAARGSTGQKEGQGRAADGAPGRARLGVRHDQLPPVAPATWPDHIVDVKRALAWTKATIAEYGGDPDFVVITGGSAGRPPLLARRAHARTSPTSSPASRTPTPRSPPAVPFYGVYDFVNRHGTGRADMEGFLARLRLQVEARRRPRAVGAGVDDQPRRAARAAVLRAPRRPTTPSCRSSRHAPSSTSSARSSTQPVVYAELPAPSTRSRSSRRSAPRRRAHAVERFLAVIRSEHVRSAPVETAQAST